MYRALYIYDKLLYSIPYKPTWLFYGYKIVTVEIINRSIETKNLCTIKRKY